MKTLSRKCFWNKSLIRLCKSQAVHESNYIEWLSSTLTYTASVIWLYYSILSRQFEFSKWIILKTELYADKTEWETLQKWFDINKHWKISWVKLQAILINVYYTE